MCFPSRNPENRGRQVYTITTASRWFFQFLSDFLENFPLSHAKDVTREIDCSQITRWLCVRVDFLWFDKCDVRTIFRFGKCTVCSIPKAEVESFPQWEREIPKLEV